LGIKQTHPHPDQLTVRGRAPNSPETHFHRVNCKCWNCAYCAPRKAKRYKRAIRITAEKLPLQRLLTLTLDPRKIEGDPVRYVNQSFAMLRVYLGRKYGTAIQYIRVLEFHQSGMPHLHILINKYIPQAWIQSAWEAVGGGRMVDIRYVDVHRVSRYLSKYLTKELLMSAPLRTRRVPLSAKGVEILTNVRPRAFKLDALVFCTKKGTPLSRRNLRNRQLDPVCDELKTPRIGWHSLRHSHATLLDAVGTPLGTVQSLLGHSSPEITRGIYLHSLPAGAKEAVQKVEDLLTGPKRTQIVEIHKMASSLIQ
jgi:hypothetical protein